jgi:hypothetical protein
MRIRSFCLIPETSGGLFRCYTANRFDHRRKVTVMDHLWTALFCTIHLGLGFFAGRGLRASEPRPTLANDLGPAVAQFQRALGAAQPAILELPEQFQAMVRDLQQSVARLEKELAKEKNKASIKSSNGDQSSATDSDPGSEDSDSGSETCGTDADKRMAERLGYAVPEFMALFDEDLQSISDFEQVQCHDLSSTGVSFFLDRRLYVGDNLLITLGQQTGGTIMAAKVVYSRPIIVRGEDRYRVGCRFLRRLKDEEATGLKPQLATARSVYSITSGTTT